VPCFQSRLRPPRLSASAPRPNDPLAIGISRRPADEFPANMARPYRLDQPALRFCLPLAADRPCNWITACSKTAPCCRWPPLRAGPPGDGQAGEAATGGLRKSENDWLHRWIAKPLIKESRASLHLIEQPDCQVAHAPAERKKTLMDTAVTGFPFDAPNVARECWSRTHVGFSRPQARIATVVLRTGNHDVPSSISAAKVIKIFGSLSISLRHLTSMPVWFCL